MKTLLFFLLIALVPKYSISQTFNRYEIDQPQRKCNFGNLGATWGDYDKDGDFDLMTTGNLMISQLNSTVLYNNVTGSLTIQQSFAPGIDYGDIKWCDFNNDNILDFVIAGTNDAGQNIIQFYKGIGSGFQLIIMNQVTTSGSPSINLVDYNNNGYQDLSITDNSSTEIYKNVLNVSTGERDFIPFRNIPKSGFSTWIDIDLDGWQELFIYNSSDFKYYKYDVVNDNFIENTPYIWQNSQYLLFPINFNNYSVIKLIVIII